MARIRTIKPEFFTSEDIVALSPMARLLYIALWCEADKEGRLVWKPATFKLRYLPGDDCSAQELCAELVEAGLVVLYGDGYAYIPAFRAHQHINPRESDSQLPDPSASSTRPARVGTRQARDSDAQGGREGKGKEGKEGKDDDAPERDDVFEQAWAEYPKRPGNSKADALKAWSARVKAGSDPRLMLEGTKRYAAFCRVQKTEPKFIKLASTFYGPGLHFEAEWEATAEALTAPSDAAEKTKAMLDAYEMTPDEKAKAAAARATAVQALKTLRKEAA